MKEGQKIFVKNLGHKGAVNICKEYDNSFDVMVDGQRLMQVEKLFRERDIQFDVTNTDAGGRNSPIRSRRLPILPQRPISPKKPVILDWKDFYPLQNVYNFLDNLEERYPSMCTISSIGKSVEGRDIKMLRISNSDAGNTAVWLDGTTHAREWISTSVVTYIADYIARNFHALPQSITNKDWYFVPVVNPDGYIHTFQVDRMWRKNRARFGTVITGVDINRNFGYFWGRGDTIRCSSGDPSHLNYRGPEAFSEPETCAIKVSVFNTHIIMPMNARGTPFKIFLTFHAHSEVIAFPWCYTTLPCPDYVNLLEGSTAMAKAIYETNGRMYKAGNFKDLMYYACGTSIDWSYGSARIPFSYLVELRSKEHHFNLPKEEIIDCCKEVTNGIKALAEFVDQKNCLNCDMFAKKKR